MKYKKIMALGLTLMIAISLPAQVALAATKDETVYGNLDSANNVEKITVSDRLINDAHENQITDTTDLENIKNVKDNVEPVKNGENIVWAAAGEDVYYQGGTSKKLPIGLKITYTLDGQSIEAKDLIGRSGHVCINVQYLNYDKGMVSIGGKQQEIYTPFTMASIVLLPNDTFKNIKSTNSKIFDDGNTKILMGFGFPGLSKSLGLDELDTKDSAISLPESFKIEADVKNYELSSIITVATPNIMDMSKTDSTDVITKIQDGVKQLTDAGNQLMNGTSTLSSGMTAFSAKFNQYLDGVHQVNDGMGKAANGLGTLRSGTQSLNSGVTSLNSGLTTLDGGAGKLAAGAQAVQTGVDTLIGSVTQTQQGLAGTVSALQSIDTSALSQADKAKINGIISQLGSSLAQAQTNENKAKIKALSDGAKGVSQGAASLKSGLDSAVAGSNKLKTGADSMNSGATELFAACKKLKDGTQKLSDNGTKLNEAAAELSDGANKLFAGATKLNVDGIEKISSKLGGKSNNLADRVKAIEARAKNYKSFSKTIGNNDSVKFVLKTAEQKVEVKKVTADITTVKAATQEEPNFWQKISNWVIHLFNK